MSTETSTSNSTSAYTEFKNMIMDTINDDNNIIGKTFSFLEKKTGVRRNYILLCILSAVVIHLVIGYGAQFLCNIIGYMYPAYASMKAIETPESRDDTKWLTYWVVFALFSTFEYPLGFILSYIPFYYLLKCIFFAWCFLPILNGASVIHNVIIKPVFLDVNEDITNSLKAAMIKSATNFIKKQS